ncbi:MAG TPA: hypothetical protein VFA41_01300 [Ktedonobacteraceae bacterium]|jgi:hypothetical protein|nr:hypothetical protein [Ktedonobacteraceae bacterium]
MRENQSDHMNFCEKSRICRDAIDRVLPAISIQRIVGAAERDESRPYRNNMY